MNLVFEMQCSNLQCQWLTINHEIGASFIAFIIPPPDSIREEFKKKQVVVTCHDSNRTKNNRKLTNPNLLPSFSVPGSSSDDIPDGCIVPWGYPGIPGTNIIISILFTI